MNDYRKYINALRKCAKEHENDQTFTGHIIVSDLCRDTANLLENDNNGVGDCPLKMFCFARMNDRTISGCSLPFVLAGMIDQSEMVVEHTIRNAEREEE